MELLLRPEFFDIFGVFGFIYIVILSLVGIKRPSSIPKWAFIVLLVIGIIGLLVDSGIVYLSYLQ
ncbi:hypothetical protein IIA94_03085 [Patescibacteria group bacterium]|nr:hypothetical protein [Patescibacteria group bacterium]